MLPTKPNSVLVHPQPPFQHAESQSGDWSDEEDVGTASGATPGDLDSALRRLRALEADLNKAKQDLVDYRQFVTKSLDVERLADAVATSTADPVVPKRDDDSHYFTSYGSNGARAPPPFVV